MSIFGVIYLFHWLALKYKLGLMSGLRITCIILAYSKVKVQSYSFYILHFLICFDKRIYSV